LVVGRISDITGRRWFIMVSLACGLLGAIVCATANTVNTVIAGTALTAVASWVQTLYPLLVAELIPNKHRPMGQAAVTLSIIPTLGFGTVIVRFMVANPALGWR
jgi:MFS family permease